MKATWKKLLAMLLVIVMMFSCVITTSAEEATGDVTDDTTTETTQPGDDTTGENTTGENTTGDGTTGEDTTGDGTTGDGTTGDGTTGDGTTGDGTTGDGTTGDGTTGDGTTGDGTTGDGTTGDGTTGDGTTGDDTTGDDTTGDGTTGDDTTGDDTTGDDTTGDDTTGDDTTGDDTTDKIALTADLFTLTGGTVAYTGSAQTAAVSTTLSAADVTIGAVTYNGAAAAPVNAGTYELSATVTATADGAYQGSVTVTGTLEITKATGGVTVKLDNTHFTYNGQDQKARVTEVAAAGIILTEDDYEVTNQAVGKDAGPYTAIVKVTNPNFDVSDGTATMQIAPISGALAITPAVTTVTYTGSPAEKPTLTVTVDGREVLSGDYDVSWSEGDYTKVGTYTATVTLNNNYNATGDNTAKLVIEPVKATLTVDPAQTQVTYNGAAQLPALTVTYGDLSLKENTDYTIEWDGKGIDVGTYTVTITGKGNFAGSTGTATLVIDPVKDTLTVDPAQTQVTYNGAAQLPTLTVTYGDLSLKENTDYTIEWDGKGIDVGTYTVTITGKGNFAGSTGTATLVIDPVKDTLTVDPAQTQVTYNGAAQLPTLTVTYGDLSLKENTDYTIEWDGKGIDVGTYAVTITGKGNFAGSTGTATVVVDPVKDTLTVDPAETKVIYNRTAQLPTLTVTYGDLSLTENTDYTIEWDGKGIDVGTYTVTITGKGNFAGSTGTATLVIDPIAEVVTVDPAETKVIYNRTSQIPELTVSYGDLSMEENVDYTIEWDGKGIDVGTYTVTITGKGNFAGSTGTATLVVDPIAEVVTVDPAETKVIYNRTSQIPELTVSYGDLSMEENVDYTIEWDGKGIDVGTYTVTITGKGNFEGSTGTATLVVDPIAEVVTVDPAETKVIYNGVSQIPTLTVSYQDLSMEEGVDYTLEWDGTGIDVNTYTATITGMGNFEGSTGTATLVIDPLDLQDPNITIALNGTEWIYTAEEQPIVIEKLTFKAADGSAIVVTIDEYTWPELVVVGDYTLTVKGNTNFTGSYDLPYSIDWLPSAGIPACEIAGDMNGSWFYGNKGHYVVAPDKYTVSYTANDVDSFASQIALQCEDGYGVTVKVHLMNAEGQITNAVSTVPFNIDRVAPVVPRSEIRISSSSTLISVDDVYDELSGIVLTICRGPNLEKSKNAMDPVEFATVFAADGTFELKPGSIDYSVVTSGTYWVKISDVAGNTMENCPSAWFADSDEDTLCDVFEKGREDFDHTLKDSDNDGLDDNLELNRKTQAMNPDTDGDDLTDGDEVNVYKTDPLKRDSDMDGIEDSVSVKLTEALGDSGMPAAVVLQAGATTDGAAAALSGDEMMAQLAELAGVYVFEEEYGVSAPVYARAGNKVRNADRDTIALNNDDFANIVVIKVDVANGRVYAIDTAQNVLVVYKSARNLVLQSAIDLKPFVGEASEVAFAIDDSASILLVSAWDGEKAASSIAVIALGQLSGSNALVYQLAGSEGTTRFAVSPDGSKLAYLLDGDVTVIDLKAADEECLDGNTAAFAKDGSLITGAPVQTQSGYTADMCVVDIAAGGEIVPAAAAFSGVYYIKQPTTGSIEVLVVLAAGQSETYPKGFALELTANSVITVSENMNELGYYSQIEEKAGFHSVNKAR